MSAATTLPAPPPNPDPPRAATPTPPALSRVLGVLRKLIDYGKHLAATVQLHAATPGLALIARPFGTADIATIIARITSGLRRAAALETKLLGRAARGQDLTPTRAPAARTPRLPRQAPLPAPQSAPQPADPTEHPSLARLPTEAEIAAEVRRRPVGAVIADICRDLGITPGQFDRASWDELAHAIIAYGGSLAGFVKDLCKRLSAFTLAALAAEAEPVPPAPPPRRPALATGPP